MRELTLRALGVLVVQMKTSEDWVLYCIYFDSGTFFGRVRTFLHVHVLDLKRPLGILLVLEDSSTLFERLAEQNSFYKRCLSCQLYLPLHDEWAAPVCNLCEHRHIVPVVRARRALCNVALPRLPILAVLLRAPAKHASLNLFCSPSDRSSWGRFMRSDACGRIALCRHRIERRIRGRVAASGVRHHMGRQQSRECPSGRRLHPADCC